MSKHARTIVGGRSTAHEDRGSYPRGVEILLKKAKVDPGFRELLLGDPLAAAESIELTLSRSERNVLSNTSRSILSAMIGRTFVPRHHVRSFLTQKAPALIFLVMASTVLIETSGASAGVESDSVASPRVNADAAEKMAGVQKALEQYRAKHGEYPSTEQWLAATNPLEGYVTTNYLFDPWMRKFHYEGVRTEAGKVENYHLESLGWRSDDPSDNVPCPINPRLHAFPREDGE